MGMLAALALATREINLFAAAGLLVGGADDLAVDLLWLGGCARRRLARRGPTPTVVALPPPQRSGRIAIFVAAWAEGEVIGPMLAHALATLVHDDYRIFVGTYPNDPATRAAVQAVRDPRVQLVGGSENGPTTKAECLNRCWDALRRDEWRTGRHYKAVLVHDAEDVVHPDELRLVDRLIEEHDLVQLPVLPLIDPASRWVSGHYADEFAELHGVQVPVRGWLGAGIPAAGVGCALARATLARMAADNDGRPFDATSLTEDYEIGLRLGALGGRGAFVALPAAPGQPLVAVRAFFPATLPAAVRQKTRWIGGIACAGWDRLRWQGGPVECWMRLRDRRAVLAAIVLACAYGGALLALGCRLAGVAVAWPAGAGWVLGATAALSVWRLGMRFASVTRFYGWREGLRAVPRVVVANLILILSAGRALATYVPGLVPAWDKTSHRFPAQRA